MEQTKIHRPEGYDPSVDYEAVLTRYNEFAAKKDRDGIKALLREHGGIISLIGKHYYQHNQPKGEGCVRNPLLREDSVSEGVPVNGSTHDLKKFSTDKEVIC